MNCAIFLFIFFCNLPVWELEKGGNLSHQDIISIEMSYAFYNNPKAFVLTLYWL